MNPPVPTFTPGLAPPSGQLSDPNEENAMNSYFLPAVIVCMILVGTLVTLRFIIRILFMKQWGFEDWTLVMATGLYIGCSFILVYGETIGGGKHQWNIDAEVVRYLLFLNNVNEIVYGFAVALLKLSLLAMYKRIFVPGGNRNGRWWVIVVVMVLNTLFYFSLTFVKIFLCWPRERIWDKRIPGRCGSLFGVLIASSVWNTASDLVILVIPMLFVWRLKLTRPKRLALIAVFAIGAIAPIFSIAGIAIRVISAASDNATYNQWRIILIAYAEMSTGFICICLPVLPRLQKWIKRKMSGSPDHQSNSNANGEYGFPSSLRERRRSTRGGSKSIRDELHEDITGLSNYIELDEDATTGDVSKDGNDFNSRSELALPRPDRRVQGHKFLHAPAATDTQAKEGRSSRRRDGGDGSAIEGRSHNNNNNNLLPLFNGRLLQGSNSKNRRRGDSPDVGQILKTTEFTVVHDDGDAGSHGSSTNISEARDMGPPASNI